MWWKRTLIIVRDKATHHNLWRPICLPVPSSPGSHLLLSPLLCCEANSGSSQSTEHHGRMTTISKTSIPQRGLHLPTGLPETAQGCPSLPGPPEGTRGLALLKLHSTAQPATTVSFLELSDTANPTPEPSPVPATTSHQTSSPFNISLFPTASLRLHTGCYRELRFWSPSCHSVRWALDPSLSQASWVYEINRTTLQMSGHAKFEEHWLWTTLVGFLCAHTPSASNLVHLRPPDLLLHPWYLKNYKQWHCLFTVCQSFFWMLYIYIAMTGIITSLGLFCCSGPLKNGDSGNFSETPYSLLGSSRDYCSLLSLHGLRVWAPFKKTV